MRGIIFVASLFVGGAGGLLFGSVFLYQYLDYRINGKPALMQLADSSKKITLPVGGPDMFLIDVKYVGPDGELLVPQKYLYGSYASRIANGEKIPVTYLRGNPQHPLYSSDDLPNPWVPLVVGAVCTAAFFYARKLLLREVGGARPATPTP